MVSHKWPVVSSKWISIENLLSTEPTASHMMLSMSSPWWLIAHSSLRTLLHPVLVCIKIKRVINLTHILEEIKPSMIPSTWLPSVKMVWAANCTEIKAMLPTWQLMLSRTSKTPLLLLTKLLLLPLVLKIIRNSLIWSMKKCSSLNCQPNLPQDHLPPIWEVKSETWLNQAPFTLRLLSKEPITKAPSHCWSPKKSSETTEKPEESKETSSPRTPSLMELKPSTPATKIPDFSDWKSQDLLLT